MSEQTTSAPALGMIEVRGRIGAIEALDAALKAANVHFVNISKVGGGLTAVFVEGEVGAVKAAVEAGGAAADRVSDLISVHIIPRPASGIRNLTDGMTEEKTSSAAENNKKEAAGDSSPEAEKGEKLLSFEQIKGYNVAKLRVFARSLAGFNMSRREINFAKRDELLEKLKAFLDGGSAG